MTAAWPTSSESPRPRRSRSPGARKCVCRTNGRFSTAMTTAVLLLQRGELLERALERRDHARVPALVLALQVGVDDVHARAELGGHVEVAAVLLERRAVLPLGAAAVLEVQERPVDGERQAGELDDARVGLVEQAVAADGEDLRRRRDLADAQQSRREREVRVGSRRDPDVVVDGHPGEVLHAGCRNDAIVRAVTRAPGRPRGPAAGRRRPCRGRPPAPRPASAAPWR